MSDSPKTRPYKWLALHYDHFFGTWRKPATVARERLIGPLLPKVESACDLACGTGTTALSLARKGIRTFAVDLAPKMCQLAQANARRARLPLRVLRADMRDFRLPQPVDLITCEGDALNHLPCRADLIKVARAVQRALRPGGHFFFDVNNSLGFQKYFSSILWAEKPGVVLVMRNGHSPKADQAWSDIEWFIREDSLWRRHHERVEEVCWDADEIRRTFREAGFDKLHAWDAAPFFQAITDVRQLPNRKKSLIEPGCRTFYIARKSLD